MASTPFLVSGIVRNSFGDVISNAQITFSIGSESDYAITDSSGKYIIDLDNMGYSKGDTVEYTATDYYNNEIFNGSFVISGESKELNISLEVREDRVIGDGNRDVTITNIGGNAVSNENPFPVITVNSLVPKTYDYVGVASASTSDTYTFRIGGVSGDVVAIIKVTYTDSTKADLSSVSKV